MFPHCRVPQVINYLYVYLVLNCTILWHFTLVEADIIVLSQKSNYTVDVFADMPANFGQILPSKGLKGLAVGANPPNACSPIQGPPKYKNYTGPWFAVIRRYDCSFVDKVRAAQAANYSGAIIHNVGSNIIEPMSGTDADDISIVAVFIGQDDALTILDHYLYHSGYSLVLTDDLPFNINSYLLPFAIVVGICFCVMLIFMIVKCIKDRRRLRRYRMPSSSLKKIPTHKFQKGDPYDTCAICLEDYVENEKLRLLPCSHVYHAKCIDPWLTRNRRVCPVCKRRILARDENLSDVDSDSNDESTPLLRPGGYGTQGGTFQNEANRAAATSTEQSPSVQNENPVENDEESNSEERPSSPEPETANSNSVEVHQAWVSASSVEADAANISYAPNGNEENTENTDVIV